MTRYLYLSYASAKKGLAYHSKKNPTKRYRITKEVNRLGKKNGKPVKHIDYFVEGSKGSTGRLAKQRRLRLHLKKNVRVGRYGGILLEGGEINPFKRLY